MIDLLTRLVAIPSLSKQEQAIAEAVCAELKQAGLSVQREGNNLWTELGDAPRPRLLVNSHLDTVPPGNAWSGDPWQPQLVDGRLTGLGANDAKGSVTAMLSATKAVRSQMLAGQRLSGTLVLALTAEEENSGNGLGTILEKLKPLDAAIVGEPTGLTPIVAQRGLLILRAVAHGRTGHPANTPPEIAENAILMAARDLLKLQDFDWGQAHPLLGRCHAHATKIGGGIALNVIPDTCEFFLDIRTTPLESHRRLYQRLCSALESELQIHSERLVPVETNLAEPIVRAAVQACPGKTPSGSPAMSDMVLLAGVPAIKIGPGDTRRSHTPDEFLHVAELEDGAAAYERIIREYFAAMRESNTPAAVASVPA